MRLSFAFARRHGVLVERVDERGAEVLTLPDTRAEVLLEVRRALGCPLTVRDVAPDEFNLRLQAAYEAASGQTEQTMADLGNEIDLDQLAQELNEPTDLLESADDAPIIRLLNALLAEAIRENASDIHIEPFEGRLAIRLRVDGVLREVMQPPAGIAPLVVSRVKVMAKLDIAERRLPQDGRISLRVANRPVDVRVSTIPAGHGERVVLRLLDKQAGRLELAQIGMDGGTTALLDDIIHKPHGIFLVTGPTGSGKTTTLYAALSRINDRTRNIMTVEDPIEYFIDGIAQTQVNQKVEMSFARGLRAILRQDPDVVMVGEIRDLETAQIAIQASLTGHMVFSTLHTNTAIGAVTRLRDMGTEPFLLASSLVGVLAQRLVRTLCPLCRGTAPLDETTARRLGLSKRPGTPIASAKGCSGCKHSGYRGRTAIYELITFDGAMRQLIHDEASEQALENLARERSASIMANGLQKILAGETTPEELLRVMQSV
ncbi:MAG: type II secretion system ATPase GspE [Gammaproteobacteria bacterium]|nr:type II secretion system ATPase GspE [Gammaproteobacteria bacterium]MBI5614717.1 type II secretion system ATPase GspE [Gammaproteobacteria bacterium]